MRLGRRPRFASWRLLPVLLLAGCAVGPDYHGPPAQTTADLPNKFKNAPALRGRWRKAQLRALPGSAQWWVVFGDPDLNALEERCLSSNQDIKVAVDRIKQAQAQTRLAAADLYPNLNVDSTGTRTRSSSTLHTQRGRVVGSFPGFTTGGETSGSNGPLIEQQPVSSTEWDFKVPMDLSWELDLFGRVRRNVESARASAEQTEADYQSTLLSTTANLASTYFNLKALDAESKIIRDTVATLQDGLNIAVERLSAGLTNQLDVEQARGNLASNQADLASVERSRGETENAIGTLVGVPASNFRLSRRPRLPEPPSVPAGLPSELLERRPDVSSAERAVASANAQIGVAVAAFYPDVKLSGLAGFETANIGDIFAAQSLIWSIGPSVTIPVFEGGRNRANLEIARASYLQTVERYRAQVLQAFQDVENALVDIRQLARQAEAQERAITAAKSSLDLSQRQYQQGAITFLNVLDSERTLLSNQRTDAQLLGARNQAVVQLIKALGGKWR